jgi:hypothetical protein
MIDRMEVLLGFRAVAPMRRIETTLGRTGFPFRTASPPAQKIPLALVRRGGMRVVVPL